MHLTIFRYKVTDNTNISQATSEKFLLHVKAKNELTIYLVEKGATNFKNMNGSYVVSMQFVLQNVFQIWRILHKK